MTYFRFLLFLGMGLFGICLVLRILLDRVFVDWDFVGDLRAWIAGISRRAAPRWILVEDEAGAPRVAASFEPAPESAYLEAPEFTGREGTEPEEMLLPEAAGRLPLPQSAPR